MVPDGWSVKQLKDIAKISGGTTPSKTEPLYWDGSIPWVTPTDVTALSDSCIFITSTKKKITHKALKETGLKLLSPGSVLMTSRATIGEVVINLVDMATNQGFCNFEIASTTDNNFFVYWLKNSKPQLKKISSGSTFLEIGKESLKKLHITLPPLPEQKRIAAILSSVDDTIEKTRAVIERTKKVKQGLLQDLLTRGIGHTKFKDSPLGKIPEEWEVAALGDHTHIKARIGWRGLSASEYTRKGAYLIAGQHIKGSKIDWSICDHISEFRYEESKEIQLQNNDIIISKDGTIGRVGFIESLPGLATINGTMMLVRPNKIFYAKFLYYYFQGQNFIRLIKEKTSGSSVPHLFQRDLIHLYTPIPSPAEQKRIAAILSNVDSQIEKECLFLDKLQTLKKGLMQDLLTGRVRVML